LSAVAELFLLTGSAFEIDWLEAQAEELPVSTRWQRRALQTVREDLVLLRRELAERMGVSVGKLNYCLRAVLARGHAKVESFRNSDNRVAYLYRLTPAGIAAKLRVARRFLALNDT